MTFWLVSTFVCKILLFYQPLDLINIFSILSKLFFLTPQINFNFNNISKGFQLKVSNISLVKQYYEKYNPFLNFFKIIIIFSDQHRMKPSPTCCLNVLISFKEANSIIKLQLKLNISRSKSKNLNPSVWWKVCF